MKPSAPDSEAGSEKAQGRSTPADREEELVDRVDELNRVIGTARRGDCHGNPDLHHRAVHVFVVNRSGQYFLQKRSLLKRIQPGRWDTSVGGHLVAGETYEQAARKELAEELGVVLDQEQEQVLLSHKHDYVWRSSIETEHVRTFLLEYEGPFRLQAEEIDEGRFWTVAEMTEAVGTGLLTPNLELEMRNLGLLRHA